MSVSRLIEEAIALFGSETKLASAAGVSQPTINEAKRKGRVGHRLARGIDEATGGKISKSSLRPDIWPPNEAA